MALCKFWGEFGPDIQWSPLHSTADGGICNIVFDIAGIDKQSGICVGVLFPCLSTVRVKGLPDLEPTTRSLTVIGAVCRKGGLVLLFEVARNAVIMQHSTFETGDFKNMIELCSGVGIASWGFKACGVNIQLAVEKQERFAVKYLENHPETTVICGDINSADTISEICALAQQPGALFAGFNCQPYSRAGSQQGALDDRSNSLHATLNIAYLLRTPIVILECVCEASSNRHVNQELTAFCDQCKYVRSDVMMKLEDLWPCKRERWWVVLTASTLGKVPLRPQVSRYFPATVKQILPHDLSLTPDELEELQLSEVEMRRFLKYQKPLSNMFLNRGGLCPTLLHSLGSQATACPCGCRAQGFSDQALSSRGIFGILMEAPGTITVDGKIYAKVRHPHPTELCILSAVPIPSTWSKPLRLWLPGIGQQANPTQSLWIMANIFRHLEVVFQGVGSFSPQSTLEQYLDRILLQVRTINEVNRTPNAVAPTPEDIEPNVDDDIPVEPLTHEAVQPPVTRFPLLHHVGDDMSFTLLSDHQTHPCVVRLSHADVTIGQMKSAEVGMTPTISCMDVVDAVTGCELPNHATLAGRCILVQVGPGLLPTPDYAMESAVSDHQGGTEVSGTPISPTIQFDVSVDSQQELSSSSLARTDEPMSHVEVPSIVPLQQSHWPCCNPTSFCRFVHQLSHLSSMWKVCFYLMFLWITGSRFLKRRVTCGLTTKFDGTS